MLSLPKQLPGELVELYIMEQMKRANIPPEVIYAFENTLLWITDDNLKDSIRRPNFSISDLEAWASAQEKYRKLNV